MKYFTLDRWRNWRMALALSLMTTLPFLNTNAQLVGNENVSSNFGIDADFYSNLLQNGTFTVPASGTDDWFTQTPGSGVGVIDSTGAAALRVYFAGASQAARNITFTRGMSANFNDVINGNRWIDAVYGRDNNSAGGNQDSSVFAGTADKNYFNPRKWDLGRGGTPAKNDLIDVMAHLRRNIATDTLWGYGGATVVSPNGDSHVDFEYFRRNFTFQEGNTTFTGITGVDSGHTAWQFAPGGRIITPGDIIISFDFSNGGTNPILSLRVWVDPAQLPGGSLLAFNNEPSKPFTFTGVFDTDAGANPQSSPYGYAEITANTQSATPYVYARVNLANQTIDATPFGFLSGPQAVYVTDNEPLTFMEFSINLTAFGLDAANTQNNPCQVLFGTLLVKTRSSTSFTAELKDFAGPYEFARRFGVAYTLSATSLSCQNTTATTTLNNMNPPIQAATVVWSGAGLVSGQGSAQATWNTGGWKYVSVTLNGTQCAKTDSIFISSNTTPPNVSIDPAQTLTCTRTSVTLTAHSTTAGATFAWSGGGTGSTKSVSAIGTYSVTATDPANGCTASATVSVSSSTTPPQVSIATPGTLTCAVTSVTLTASSTTAGATFAWAGGPSGANKTVSLPGTYTVTATDPSTGCTASATVSVSQNTTPPSVTIDPAQQLTCTRTSVTLTAHAASGITFAWSGGGTGSTKTVSAIGTYTVTATDPNTSCTSTATVSVTQNITPPNLTIDAPLTLTCTRTSVTLTAHSTTPGATFAWGGGGTGPTKVVTALGTYSVTVTDPNNGCTTTGMVGVQQDITPPVAEAGAGGTLSCTVFSVTLDGSGSTPGMSYHWTASNGGHIASGANGLSPVVDAAGTYTLVVTNPANGCTASDAATVNEIHDNPTCQLSAPQYLPLAGSTGNTLTANLSNFYTATWSVSSLDGSWVITNDDGNGTITYTAGNAGVLGNFKVVLVNQTGTCKDSCEVSFFAASGDVFCGMTQGFYGNFNGKYCDQRSKTQLMTDILTGNPLTVGVLGTRALTMTAADVNCIIARLPAGGPPNMLPPNNNNQLPANMTFTQPSCNTTPYSIQTQNGRFRNVFLGQTITLGLNLRLGGLANLRITDNWLITAGIASGPNNLICDDPGQPIITGSERYYYIPQSVINYLGANNTVADLFALANLSLAGIGPASPSRSEINDAVSAFNEGFDGCRRFIGFSDSGPQLKTDDLTPSEEYYDDNLEFQASFSIHPNPFSSLTFVNYTPVETSNVKIEVMDATGRLMKSVYEGLVESGVTYESTIDGSNYANGLYIVRISTDNFSIQKRLIVQR